MLDTNIDQVTTWAKAYIERLSPNNRKRLAKRLAEQLRRTNQKRIQNQTSPDGYRWPERQKYQGKTDRRKMFVKMKHRKHLRIRERADGFALGFFGRLGKIAETHHYGQKQRLRSGIIASYPSRELIGITDTDKEILYQVLIQSFSR